MLAINYQPGKKALGPHLSKLKACSLEDLSKLSQLFSTKTSIIIYHITRSWIIMFSLLVKRARTSWKQTVVNCGNPPFCLLLWEETGDEFTHNPTVLYKKLRTVVHWSVLFLWPQKYKAVLPMSKKTNIKKL